MTFIEHGVETGCDPSVSADGTISILSGGIVNQNVGASVSAQNWTAASGDPSFDRYDTLYATSSGSISALTGVVDGTLIQPDSTDVVIAKYIMRAGATTVAAADLQDVRTFVKRSFTPYRVSGLWYGNIGLKNASNQSFATGDTYLSPFWTGKNFPVQALSVQVGAPNATAGSKARLGIYADDGSGGLSLLIDAGQVAVDAGVGTPSVAITATLTPGTWWLAIALQNLGATKPNITSANIGGGGSPFSPVGATNINNMIALTGGGMFYSAAVTGAFPATLTSPDYSKAAIPIVGVQAA